MSVPRVSIGLPVYNGELYIRKALESLLGQDFSDLEVIISDNASTDRTREICQEYAAHDKRIRYYRNDVNIGAGPNYRRVFELARGEFFKWCAHDDVCHPAFISECLKAFDDAAPSVIMVYPRCEMINGGGEVLDRPLEHVGCSSARPHRRLARVVRRVSRAYPMWGLIRSKGLRQTQLTGSVAYWDEVLLVDLSLYGQILELPKVLFQQRSHAGNSFVLCSDDQGGRTSMNPDKISKQTRQRLRNWNDPSQSAKKVWLRVQEERICEYLKRVQRAKLPLCEKLLCFLVVPIVGYWKQFCRIGGALRNKLRIQKVAGVTEPAPAVNH